LDGPLTHPEPISDLPRGQPWRRRLEHSKQMYQPDDPVAFLETVFGCHGGRNYPTPVSNAF
jgi:hypothetical protein